MSLGDLNAIFQLLGNVTRTRAKIYAGLNSRNKLKNSCLLGYFWFRFKCVDLDCDGVITPNEMQYFYEEQLHRMECMAQEPVLFEDIVCQMADMIGPAVSF